MANDSPDWQALTDVALIQVGGVDVPAFASSGSAVFPIPATATGLRLLVATIVGIAPTITVTGTTTGQTYGSPITLASGQGGPLYFPVQANEDASVTILYDAHAQLGSFVQRGCWVDWLGASGYQIVQSPLQQPLNIKGSIGIAGQPIGVTVNPNPLPVDPGGRLVGISGQPIGVTVNPNPLPITGIPNPLPVDASGHTVPVSGPIGISGQPIGVTVNPNPLPVTGTVTVNENPRISAEQRVQFNVTATTTIVAGVAGKVLTLIGFRFSCLDAGGVFPSIGTWILWSTSSNKVLAQGSYYAATAAGLLSMETSYRDADGKPPSAPAGEGLQLASFPAGGTTQQYLGFADFTQV